MVLEQHHHAASLVSIWCWLLERRACHLAETAYRALLQQTVVVLLHDVNRKVEQKIIERLLTSKDGSIQHLGIIKGVRGDLAGFRVGPPGP